MLARSLSVITALAFTGLCAAVGLGWFNQPSGRQTQRSELRIEDIPFNGQRAYEYLKAVCEIGPRPSGSPGMAEQQKLLAEHFRNLGGNVHFQNFRIRHPLDGSPVLMSNLVVQWHPETNERILLCAHYDTRPYPDQDKHNPRGTFIGANDGGSGVAMLMEMAHLMPEIKGDVGVDFVLFDGEELIFSERFGERGKYFWGSEYFATVYAEGKYPARFRYGVLLDMVADDDLQLYYERRSLSWKETRPLVHAIWEKGAELGVHEFIAQRGHSVNDDHVPLNEIGKIPTCDIIDFDYPYWHTEGDTLDKCSALSLAKVGWVVHEWLKDEIARKSTTRRK